MTLKCGITIICLVTGLTTFAQHNYFVSQEAGSNSNNGQSPSTPFKTVEKAVEFLSPGDTLLIMGIYVNASYDTNYSYAGNTNDPHIWSQENTLKINNLHGTSSNYITIKSYDSNTVLKGDGANIFRMINCSYIRIEGLEIYGEVEQIPLSTAQALQFLYRENGSTNTLYRVPPGTSDAAIANLTLPVLNNISRPSYTDTRGIYLSTVHHIDLIGNYIHHTPGNGFRVADCDYINIINNEVDNTSRKSYSGTHAMVVASAHSFDTFNGYKINILQNKVHHNYNEIYSWSPNKTFINPYIDEGKGISLQTNDLSTGWTHGRFLVANNLTYWNGYSGIHSNTGIRMDFINNTVFMNSYTKSVTYNMATSNGGNIGISTQSGEDIRIINNISVIDSRLSKSAISSANTNNLVVKDNLIYGSTGPVQEDSDVAAVQINTIIADPKFVDSGNLNFSLQASSPAIGIADTGFAPADDFFGYTRDINPDLGAIEYNNTLSVISEQLRDYYVYPNPASDRIYVHNKVSGSISLYTLSGQKIPLNDKFQKTDNDNLLLISALPNGIYLLKINDEVVKIIKR